MNFSISSAFTALQSSIVGVYRHETSYGGVVAVAEQTASTLSRKNIANSSAESSSDSSVKALPSTASSVRHSLYVASIALVQYYE